MDGSLTPVTSLNELVQGCDCLAQVRALVQQWVGTYACFPCGTQVTDTGLMISYFDKDGGKPYKVLVSLQVATVRRYREQQLAQGGAW